MYLNTEKQNLKIQTEAWTDTYNVFKCVLLRYVETIKDTWTDTYNVFKYHSCFSIFKC